MTKGADDVQEESARSCWHRMWRRGRWTV